MVKWLEKLCAWREKRKHEALIRKINKPFDHSNISPFDAILLGQNPEALNQWRKNVELQNRDKNKTGNEGFSFYD